jgi:nucleoside-diphosphate-sugar epimerase
MEMNKDFSAKVLVTGAAGFIGSRVCELLAESKMSIVAIDNFDPYYDVRLKRYRWDQLSKFNSIERLELELTDVPALEALFEAHSFDAVINLAAMAGVRYSIENPAKYFRVNSQGFVGLLETMRKHEVSQIVQASTSSLYAGLPMPFEETLDVRTPISPYAASKLGAEAIGYTYASLHGFDVTVLRYFTVYGPAGRPDMAPFRFVEWCLRGDEIQLFGDGQQSRDFTYVDDIARGTIAALQKRLPGFEIINLGGGGERTTILEIIQMIGEYAGVTPKIKFLPKAQGDMLHTSASIEKAKARLDWEPLTTLTSGFEAIVKWHLMERGILDLCEM